MKRITPSTFKLYGVFGFPLKHTLSPVMHQAAFNKLKLSSFYLALELAPNDFKRLMALKKNLLLDGFNLTIPHKQIVIPHLDSVSREAKLIGAVNTVVRKGNRFSGENTDAYGFSKSLSEGLNWNSKGKTVLILGAGGASRACIYAFCRGGVKNIVILNRTIAKARALAKFFKRQFPKVRFAVDSFTSKNISWLLPEVDMVVNATSIGLKRGDSALAVIPKASGKQFAVDLIYNPAETPFLRAAKRAGWQTLNGLGMLLHQGARAFELWTGKKAPIGTMKQVLDRALSSRGGR